MQRKPSHFGSYVMPGAVGSLGTLLASIGSTGGLIGRSTATSQSDGTDSREADHRRCRGGVSRRCAARPRRPDRITAGQSYFRGVPEWVCDCCGRWRVSVELIRGRYRYRLARRYPAAVRRRSRTCSARSARSPSWRSCCAGVPRSSLADLREAGLTRTELARGCHDPTREARRLPGRRRRVPHRVAAGRRRGATCGSRRLPRSPPTSSRSGRCWSTSTRWPEWTASVSPGRAGGAGAARPSARPPGWTQPRLRPAVWRVTELDRAPDVRLGVPRPRVYAAGASTGSAAARRADPGRAGHGAVRAAGRR